jgi:hypothetical protein
VADEAPTTDETPAPSTGDGDDVAETPSDGDVEPSPETEAVAPPKEQPEQAAVEAPEAGAEEAEIEEGKDEERDETGGDRGLPDDEPIPEVFTFPKVQTERPSRRRSLVPILLISALVVVVLAGTLYTARKPLVTFWPATARLYDSVGILPYLGYGLDVPRDALKIEFQEEKQAYTITGILLNNSDRERPVPDLRISLLDADGEEVQSVVTRVDADHLSPGKQVPFAVLVENPAATARRVEVAFADRALATN